MYLPLGRRALGAWLASALTLAAWPTATATADAPDVLVLPIDRAEFLPGARFDLRVEVHADSLPVDFEVRINREDASAVLGARPKAESWAFGDDAAVPSVQSWVWRDVRLPHPGAYHVEVTAGGATTSVEWTARQPGQHARARNVILFIADGMTVPLLTAARLVSLGNTQGRYDGHLNVDRMEEIGLIHTSGMDSIIADSANSASAYNTGHKTAINAIGVYPDTSPDNLDDPRQETLAEILKRVTDKSVGVVTTDDLAGATPAAVFAHTRHRGDRVHIAADLVDRGLGFEVLMGGGARHMLPMSIEGSEREDERDLMAEYEAAGYQVVEDATGLAEAVDAGAERLLGVFHWSDMDTWLDRNVYTDNSAAFPDQPGLVEMTLAALETLGREPAGFYLMVEASGVDTQMHRLDQERALADLIELDQAVGAAMQWAATTAPDTLIVVTSDHGHGYDVYGTVDVAAFDFATDDLARREAIGIYGEAGFPTYADGDDDGFPDEWAVDRTIAGAVNNAPEHTEDFQVSPKLRLPSISGWGDRAVDNPDDDPSGILVTGNLPPEIGGAVHTLQDVPVFAHGPGAESFGRVMDNTALFFAMADAMGLDPRADDMLPLPTRLPPARLPGGALEGP